MKMSFVCPIRRFFHRFNPDLLLIDKAVDIVVEACSPRLVYLVGPTSVGYVEDRRVELLVVVDEGDRRALRSDLTWALVDEFIDGDVSVYTLEEFEEYCDDGYSTAYRAMKKGRIAYKAGFGR